MKLIKINVNTITIGLIIAGMILSSLLQVKAFIPTNNTAACAAAALAVNVSASASQAMANEEREQDKDKEPDIVTTVFGFIALLCLSALLFMCLFQLVGLFLGKDNGI